MGKLSPERDKASIIAVIKIKPLSRSPDRLRSVHVTCGTGAEQAAIRYKTPKNYPTPALAMYLYVNARLTKRR